MRTKWINRPISPTCESRRDPPYKPCGKGTAAAYPAWGWGWMALCTQCAKRHPEATPIRDLMARGENISTSNPATMPGGGGA